MLLESASGGDCYVADLVPDMPAALCGEMCVLVRGKEARARQRRTSTRARDGVKHAIVTGHPRRVANQLQSGGLIRHTHVGEHSHWPEH